MRNARRVVPRSRLLLQEADIHNIAHAGLRHGQDLLDERVDRVFVHRAVEWAVARRLCKDAPKELKHLLTEVADEAWVERAYGVEFLSEADDQAGEDISQVDERGVHTHYGITDEHPSMHAVEELARKLMERRERARRTASIPILDTYFKAPSLWLGPTPSDLKEPLDGVSKLHQHLLSLTSPAGQGDWMTRLLVMQALRRALLRESVLLRLLPEKTDREERSWGELLAERFIEPLRGQHESMSDRITVFVEDILSAGGPVQDRLCSPIIPYQVHH